MKPDSHIPPAHLPAAEYNREHPLLANPGETQLMQHLPQLDGVRAIAVLLVVWHHFEPSALRIPQGPSWGAIGVGLFFTLSGFLITRILLGCRLRMDEGKSTLGQMLKQFYARRFLRIFPLYYGLLALLAIFNPTDVRDRIWWHVAYLSNVRFSYWQKSGEIERHLWSLSVEEQFYIFWPLVILLAPRKLLLPLIVAVVVSAPVYRALTYTPGFLGHEWMMPACLDLLGIGALLALLSMPQFGLSRWWGGFVETMGVIGVPLFFVFVALKSISIPLHPHPRTGRMMYDNMGFEIPGGATYLVTSFAAVWLIAMAARGFKGPFGWLLSCAPLVYIGRISYGLYVIHMFVPHLLHWAFPDAGFTAQRTWREFAIFTAVSIGLATVSWYAYEAPINRLKKYFEYDRK